MRVVRLLLGAIVVLLVVIFALSNRQPVQLGFWPTGLTWEAPLSLAVLAVAALFFLGGAVLGWSSTLGQRRRARQAEAQLRVIEAQRPVSAAVVPQILPPGR